MNGNILDELDSKYKCLLEGNIIFDKRPELLIDENNKMVTITFFRNTYIRVGFCTYIITHDTSCFSNYTDDSVIRIAYNPYTRLFMGFGLNDTIGEDNISIGALLFRGGKLEDVSFMKKDNIENYEDLSITGNGLITIDHNIIKFPSIMNVCYRHHNDIEIKFHNDIQYSNKTDKIALYYNTILCKFIINPVNSDNSILVAIYDTQNNMIGFNRFPNLIQVGVEYTPIYKAANWSYNYDSKNNYIEWPNFYVINENNWETQLINAGKLIVEDINGDHFIVFDPNTFEVEIISNPKSLPINSTFLGSFKYDKGIIKEFYNTTDGLMPLEDIINKIKKDIDIGILDHDNTLVLPRKIYIVDNNPILKSSMTISGDLQNQITVIDENNKISYPCIEVEFKNGLNRVYSGDTSKTIEVFNYSREEIIKNYKFGFISNINLYKENSLPGEIIFNYNNAISYEYLIGMDTSEGISPFVRIAGDLDKERYPAWCYRRTGTKNEMNYSNSSDKSGDFYIFDLRYYLLSLGLNDNEPLTHIILNTTSKSDDSAIEAIKAIYTILHDSYPNINIGVIPMLKHGARNSNTDIKDNKIRCNFANKLISYIDLIDDIYKIDILPMWLYINPMVNNNDAMLSEAWNCIVGWANNTL